MLNFTCRIDIFLNILYFGIYILICLYIQTYLYIVFLLNQTNNYNKHVVVNIV